MTPHKYDITLIAYCDSGRWDPHAGISRASWNILIQGDDVAVIRDTRQSNLCGPPDVAAVATAAAGLNQFMLIMIELPVRSEHP